MRRHLLQLGFFFTAIMLLVPPAAYAAQSNVAVTINVGPIYNFYMTGQLNWTHPGVDIPGMADFNAEVPDYAPPYNWESQGYGWTLYTKDLRIWVCANQNWKLEISGTSPTFAASSPWAKPCGDIVWKDGNPLYWKALTTTPVIFHNGGPMCQNHLDPDSPFYVITFHVLLHWAHDKPGFYTYNNVLITLSGN